MTPRSMRIAYQIYTYAAPREWDCTIAEIAEGIGVNAHVVRGVCQHKGWTHRLRGETRDADAQVAYLRRGSRNFLDVEAGQAATIAIRMLGVA